METSDEAHRKLAELRAWLKARERVAVAFSGGADSTFLLAVAHEALDGAAIAITADSPAYPARELESARAFCAERGIRHVEFKTSELSLPGFDRNPENRCYLCKRALLSAMLERAEREGAHILAEGSNADDAQAHRPGHAAVVELGCESPLQQVGLSKREIRFLSRELALPTWDKPSLSCLYTRFPYGEKLTLEALARIEEAEQLLINEGFSQVRVRVHGPVARIEVDPCQVELLARAPVRTRIVNAFMELGFGYATVDLQGFRSGSMDERPARSSDG